MYTQFFRLKQSPFSIAPDPRYLFMSARHREALAHLLYGVGNGGGFVLLTGEIGAGKTTVCRCFMEQIPANCKLAYIFNPKLSVEELLLSICDEFRIPLPAKGGPVLSTKHYVDAINGYLLVSHAQKKNNVLIIDEAQNLSAEVLEQLRLLTNLETSERKLLQIILIGQPELRTMLARPELEQLAQRVMARYHLGSLSEAETGSYIKHRLAVAGAGRVRPFPRRLMPQIQRLSKGVPRRINLLCDRALLGAYVENATQVTPLILSKAAEEVFFGEGRAASRPRPMVLYSGAGLLAGVLITAAVAWSGWPHRPAATAARAVVAAGSGATAAMAASAPLPATAAVVAKPVTAAPAATAAMAHSVLAGTSKVLALRELALLWNQVLPVAATCEAAAQVNLRCHQGKGGLYELRQLDRPAILSLHGPVSEADPDGVSYAVLRNLSEAGATLRIGGKDHLLSLAELTARFDGDFLTFWAAPGNWRETVAAGDRGADVDWLAQRLAQLNNVAPTAAGQPLSAKMLGLLRQFQQSHDLKADGMAGPRTFIRLVPPGDATEPHLLAAPRAGVAVTGK